MKLFKLLLILFVLGVGAFFALNLFKGRPIFEFGSGLTGPTLPKATDELREGDRKELQNILDNLPDDGGK